MSLRSFRNRARVFVLMALLVCLTPARVFAQERGGPPRDAAIFGTLYTSFAALQAMDVHSTVRAIDGGAKEMNPLVGGIAANGGALLATKAGAAATTIFLAEKVRKRSRIGALLLMAGINSGYAIIVARNYAAR
jgi:hypothetical protein